MHKHWKRSVRSRHSEGGQAIILIALMMVALIGMLGMAVDGGGLYFLHRDTQNATDSAAIAALYTKCTLYPREHDDDVVASGEAAANSNGFATDTVNNLTTVTIDPDYVPFAGADGLYVRATISTVKPSYFIQLVYPNQLWVTSSTIGECHPAGANLLPTGYAIISLRANYCIGHGDDGPSFRVTGDAIVNVINGSIYVNTDDDGHECALSVTNNANLNVNGTCSVVSDPGHDEDQTVADGDDPPPINCEDGVTHPTGDDIIWSLHPLRDLDPPDNACASAPQAAVDVKSGKTKTLNPGNYPQIRVRSGGTLIFNPGLYCIKQVTINGGTITGTNIVIYMPEDHNGWHSTGQATIQLEGPGTECVEAVAGDACDWPGLLLWADISDADELNLQSQTEIHFNGGAESRLSGMIYGPRSSCEFEGHGESFAINSQAVCWSVDFNGTSQFDIIYEPPAFLMTPPSVVLNS